MVYFNQTKFLLKSEKYDKFKKADMMPAREQVASILRSSILLGEIAVGTSITLDSISEQVGLSRTPVREAFQILATEGLLELRQNRCAIVKGVSEEAIRDHYEIRILLETEALRKACEHMDEKILVAIQKPTKCVNAPKGRRYRGV